MRVIAGKARSIHLKTVPGMNTRPTTDRIKETLFNMLQPYMVDCDFLDLFAGSGAIGIEALSRGAHSAVFVEQNQKAIECIKENLAFTKLADGAKVMKSEVLSSLHLLENQGSFHCIFMDPPYDKGLEQQVLQVLADSPLADEDTLIIVEAALDTDFSYLEEYGYQLIKQKKYKTNQHLFLKKLLKI